VTLVREITVGLLWLAVVVAVLATGFYYVSTAHGSAVCLTKKEARHLWPRKHIYWYSRDHCWSNRRGPPRGIKIDAPILPDKAVVKTPDYAELASAAIAAPPAPVGESDANANSITKPRMFEDRWSDQPWIGIILRDAINGDSSPR